MKNKILSFLTMLFLGSIDVCAQNLIEGYTRVYYADDLKEGKAYFIISDRMKFAGNNTATKSNGAPSMSIGVISMPTRKVSNGLLRKTATNNGHSRTKSMGNTSAGRVAQTTMFSSLQLP